MTTIIVILDLRPRRDNRIREASDTTMIAADRDFTPRPTSRIQLIRGSPQEGSNTAKITCGSLTRPETILANRKSPNNARESMATMASGYLMHRGTIGVPERRRALEANMPGATTRRRTRVSSGFVHFSDRRNTSWQI